MRKGRGRMHLLLDAGGAYKKEGPKFMQCLVAKQAVRGKDS